MSAFKLLASALLVTACSALPASVEQALGRRLAADDDAAAEWTYRRTGEPGVEPYGPDDWYLGYPECALNRQSPINIAADLSVVREAADFTVEFVENKCDSSELVFFENEAVWQVYFDGCTEVPYLMFQGEKYNMLQFHIHSPSEYTFGAAEHAADLHLVHVKDGADPVELLVVGVMFDVTEYGKNNEIENLWNVLGVGGTSTNETFTTSIYDILPPSISFSHFLGSLTTPPCTQGVKWLVMNEPSFLGKRQLDEYRRAVALYPGSKVDEFGNTNRPIQPLNDRPLIHVLEG